MNDFEAGSEEKRAEDVQDEEQSTEGRRKSHSRSRDEKSGCEGNVF